MENITKRNLETYIEVIKSSLKTVILKENLYGKQHICGIIWEYN